MKSSFILRRLALTAILLCVWLSTQVLAQKGTPVSKQTVEFLVVGDWGTGGVGAKRVAKAMTSVYQQHGATAVLSTGDNFYPSGVSDVHDPQWQRTFEKIFPAPDLPVPFWAVLGNHDYRKNPDAQVAYSGRTLADGSVTRWRMPGRSWSTAFASADGKVRVRVIGIDTQQLIAGAEKRKAHLAWIDSALAAADEEWKLVVGHHPVYSHGHYKDNAAMKRHLSPLMERHGVHAYLNGHDHDLQVIKQVNGIRYLISGGGASKRKTAPGERTEFCAASMGFMRIACSKESMLIEVYDANAKLLYTARDAHVRKWGK
jgi:tartrate-resistant acid phosphatase type 5